MKKFVSLATILLIGVCAFSQTFYVSVKSSDLRAKPSATSKSLKKVAYGDAVTVVDDSKGNWTLVSIGKTEGWISSSSLSKRKIVVSDKKVSTDAKEIALAGKGFGDGISATSSGNGNYSAVEALEKNEISEKENKSFVSQGGLKSAE